MSDSNPTRVRYAQNKAAFNDVIGDPYAKPDPIEGQYYRLKRRSTMRVANIDDVGHATGNAARPNAMDFFCDVERCVNQVITNKHVLENFWITYLEDDPLLNQHERNELEQKIGKKFAAHRISPVARYFVTIRRPLASKRGNPAQG